MALHRIEATQKIHQTARKMSHTQEQSNATPDVEILGEWDHGIMDPVFESQGKPANPYHAPDLHLSYQDLKATVLKVEDDMETAVRNTFHRVEHAVEEMIHLGGDVQSFDDELTGIVDAGVSLVPMEDHSER